MKVIKKIILFGMALQIFAGCPSPKAPVNISGALFVSQENQDVAANLSWLMTLNNKEKPDIVTVTRMDKLQVIFSVETRIGDFDAEKVTLPTGNKTFHYEAFYQDEVNNTTVSFDIREKEPVSYVGWPCQHWSDTLEVELIYIQDVEDGKKNMYRFKGEHTVLRTQNPFNNLRYDIHKCP